MVNKLYSVHDGPRDIRFLRGSKSGEECECKRLLFANSLSSTWSLFLFDFEIAKRSY